MAHNAKSKLSGKRAQAGTGQRDAGDSGTGDTTSLVLEYLELQRDYDQLDEDERTAEEGEGQQIRADLTALKRSLGKISITSSSSSMWSRS